MNSQSALDLLTELFTDLRQIQIQLIRWLPTLAAKVSHPGFRHLVGKHVQESAAHLQRLDQFFSLHQTQPTEGTSKAVKLIIDHSNGIVPDLNDPDRSDLFLLIQMLRVEQFEITSYEIVARVADQLGLSADTEMLLEFLAQRDAAASILRDLQSEMIENAFPTDVPPPPSFTD